MFGLFVIKPGRELPVRSLFLTQLRHQLSGDQLNLVVTLYGAEWDGFCPFTGLAPGMMRDRETGGRYWLHQVVHDWGSRDCGVWATALDAMPDNATPNIYWPLYTGDGGGWMNQYEGDFRFDCLHDADVQINPAAPDPDLYN